MEDFSLLSVIAKKSIGPSSSHTDASYGIGKQVFKEIQNKNLKKIKLILYNSFADTGFGHMTIEALIAGILNMDLEKENIAKSVSVLKKKKIDITIKLKQNMDFQPNSVIIEIKTKEKEKFSFLGVSLGGGKFNFNKIDK